MVNIVMRMFARTAVVSMIRRHVPEIWRGYRPRATLKRGRAWRKLCVVMRKMHVATNSPTRVLTVCQVSGFVVVIPIRVLVDAKRIPTAPIEIIAIRTLGDAKLDVERMVEVALKGVYVIRRLVCVCDPVVHLSLIHI